MVKIVINTCTGGFSISRAAAEHMAANGSERAKLELEQCTASISGVTGDGWFGYDRTDPLLVQAVEELGSAANNTMSELSVVEMADDVDWVITEENGYESVQIIVRPLKIYRVEFKPIWPVGGCLVLVAYNQEQAEELARITLARDGITEFVVSECTPTEPTIIEYLSGDY